MKSYMHVECWDALSRFNICVKGYVAIVSIVQLVTLYLVMSYEIIYHRARFRLGQKLLGSTQLEN